MPDSRVANPRPLETRWPCPVCVGVLMEKKRFDGPAGSLTLDYCTRCGGLWFDRGEVGQLARRPQAALRGIIIERADRVRPPCQECQAPLDRDAEKCGVCGRANILDCPVCDRPMERRAHEGLVLDVCKNCQGVWFDNAELTTIWRLNMAAATAKRSRGAVGGVADVGGDILFNTLFWAPDLVLYGGMAAGQAAGAVVEVAGSAAEGVFSTVMEIIAGLFD